ncbi:hypothetical protein ACQQCD_05110 [Pseudarthrobacter sp. J1763]|uniref:hypothetical protein n=1 Tax=Pseudarthrobacter sp. J1763 TaxID=3420445 RepID=UPI003D29E3AB
MAPVLVSAENPGDHNPAEIESSLVSLHARVGALEQAQRNCRALPVEVQAIWEGRSATAWSIVMERMAGLLGAAAEAVSQQQSALRSYGEELKKIQVESRTLLDHRQGANNWLLANPATPPIAFLDSISLPKSADLALHEEKQTELWECERSLDVMRQRRFEADERLEQALVQHAIHPYVGRRQAFLNAGIADPEGLSPQARGTTLATAAQAFLKQPGDFESYGEQLVGMLLPYADDPETMSAFYESLGAKKTLDLKTLLAQYSQAGTEFGSALVPVLLNGLAVGTQSWDSATARKYFSSITGESKGRLSLTASPAGLGALFTGTMPMGASAVMVASEILDKFARQRSGTDGAALHTQILKGMAPLLTRVATTKDLALEFLSGDIGAERIKYWFAQDFSNIDEFVSVALLWQSIEQAVSANNYKGQIRENTAVMSFHIIQTLLANPSVIDGHSPEAGEIMANAVAIEVPGLAATTLSALNKSANGTTVSGQMFDATQRTTPRVEREELTRLVKIVMHHDRGERLMRSLADEYASSTADASSTMNISDKIEAAKRSVQLWTIVDAASQDKPINQAEVEDQQITATGVVVKTAVGYIPMGKLLSFVVARTPEQQVSWLGLNSAGVHGKPNWISALLAHHADDAKAASNANLQRQELHLRMVITASLGHSLGVDVVEPAGGVNSDSKLSDQQAKEWLAKYQPPVDAAIVKAENDAVTQGPKPVTHSSVNEIFNVYAELAKDQRDAPDFSKPAQN